MNINKLDRSPFHSDKLLEDFEGEEWIDVIGYDGIYNVSNYGRIKSVERLVSNGKSQRIVNERILSQATSKDGRNTVALSFNSKLKTFSLNQVVFFSFNEYQYYNSELKEVIHLDKNPKNNALSNLKLVSRKESKRISIEKNKLNFSGIKFYNSNRKKEYQAKTELTCNFCAKTLPKCYFEYGRGKCKNCRNIDNTKRLKAKRELLKSNTNNLKVMKT